MTTNKRATDDQLKSIEILKNKMLREARGETMTKEELDEMSDKEKIEAGICPECGGKLIPGSGCATCCECGWSPCKVG